MQKTNQQRPKWDQRYQKDQKTPIFIKFSSWVGTEIPPQEKQQVGWSFVVPSKSKSCQSDGKRAVTLPYLT